MAILDEDVARVRAETDFVAVASEHIALKRQGRSWVGLCPFHAEKTPSFSLNAEQGVYYCFGCGAGGDVITFVREVGQLDFVEAVEHLAGKAGIAIRRDGGGGDRQRHKELLDAMEKAVEWYHERLLSAPDAAPARAYLRRVRGYDGEVVRTYRLGWAPTDWDVLARSLSAPDHVLRDTGLGYVNRVGRRQDAFRGRIMFPIFDVGGRPVAFGGRLLPESGVDGPKYKNSPDTPIYSKRRTLYGLNWAKRGIVDRGEVVVCEGYTDVIAMFVAGVPRAVATCGTSLADEHFRVLKNFARRVVLAYDADAAGQAAAERFHEWEQRYEMDIAVARLPAGSDPADVARQDPGALRRAVDEALPFLAFRIERVLGAADLRAPESRARAAAAALEVVADHPNPLVRDQYVMAVADRCHVDPDRLRGMLDALARRGRSGRDGRPVESRRQPVAAGAPLPAAGRAAAELAALRLAVHRPSDVADRLEEVLFADPAHQAAFRALAASSTLHEAVAAAEPDAASLITRLAVEEPDDDPDDVTAHLARLASRRALASLQATARTASSDELPAIAADTAWVKLETEALDDEARRVEATRLLVAWLSERGDEVSR